MSASMMERNRVQRGRPRTASLLQVEAAGEGLLCFSPNGSSFVGQLQTDDDRHFDMSGRLLRSESSTGVRQPPTLLPASVDGDSGGSGEGGEDHTDENHSTILLEPVSSGSEKDSSETVGVQQTCDSRPDSPAAEANGIVEGLDIHARRKSSCASVPSSLVSPRAFEEAMHTLADVSPGAPVMYDVSIFDHEEGSEHRVRYVAVWSGGTCQLDCEELQFTAERRYRGERADMIIQRRLGPAQVGRHCVVFTGQMTIKYQYDYLNQPKWCL